MFGTLLKKVLSEYQQQKLLEFGTSDFMDIVNHDIPELLKSSVGQEDKYKIYGSCGMGYWAETPWVAILNRRITESTQEGYYICFLFDTKDKVLYLSLAVGWTQFQENFSIAEASKRIVDYSAYLAKKLPHIPSDFSMGKIDLKGDLRLSRGYELGQIISKNYSLNAINDEILWRDLNKLLGIYDDIANLVGNDILNIDYSKVVNNKNITKLDKAINQITLLDNPEKALDELQKIIVNEPPRRKEVILKQVVRNRKIASLIKIKASYVCEICQRKPFTQKNGQPYAEADHIKPLGGRSKGLDSPENLRCVCAQCHAIITYGSEEAIRKLIA